MARITVLIGFVLALLAPAAAGATEIESKLIGVRSVGDDVQRLTFRYGPLVAAPGQNLNLVGPVTIEKPPIDGYSVRVKPNLVRADGTPPPVEEVHMHHAVLLNLSRPDRTSPSFPERFYGFGEEKTIGSLPDGFGYPVKTTETWAMNYMLHNGTPNSETVWVELEVDFIPAASPRGQATKPAYPLALDVENHRAYPVFDVHRGSGSNGRYTYAPDHGRNVWTVDEDGVLLMGFGHVHPGGLWVDLDVERGARRVRAFRSEAKYFDPNGPVSWDLAMTHTPDDWRVGVREGDRLRVTTTYDSAHGSWYESMGIIGAYWAPGEDGPDPFADPPPTKGEPTHGHLPEAGNYGGKPSGRSDPAELPDGQTLADGVAIEDFLYTPGDRAFSNQLGNPPLVAPGGSLRFGNFDAAAQIYHTVTACKPPCTGTTGVSYPLADADAQFDSGQLGYGPEGYTAAAQRADWETPKDLEPGTYTYFCRVHPFMRGAFRVPGEPRRRGGGASGARPAIVSRRLRRLRGGRTRVRLRCEGASGQCAGRVRISRRGRRLGSARFRIAAGRTATVTVRLNRAGRRLARRGRSVRVTAGSGSAKAARTLRFRRRASRRSSYASRQDLPAAFR